MSMQDDYLDDYLDDYYNTCSIFPITILKFSNY